MNRNVVFISVPGVLENLYFGADVSNCPLPCEVFSTETKLTSTIDSDFNGFGLSFQKTVEVDDVTMLIKMYLSSSF